MLLYASLTGRYAVLRTPRGLSELMRRGALTQPELNALLHAEVPTHCGVCPDCPPSLTHASSRWL